MNYYVKHTKHRFCCTTTHSNQLFENGKIKSCHSVPTGRTTKNNNVPRHLSTLQKKIRQNVYFYINHSSIPKSFILCDTVHDVKIYHDSK